MSGTDNLANFLSYVGDAITDVRHKVVEEPWFGRVVTEGHPPAFVVPVGDGEAVSSRGDAPLGPADPPEEPLLALAPPLLRLEPPQDSSAMEGPG